MGIITMASDGECLSGLWFEGQKYFYGTLPEQPVRNDELPVFTSARAWLDRYFRGEAPRPSELPLAPIGGEFRQAVWKIIQSLLSFPAIG